MIKILHLSIIAVFLMIVSASVASAAEQAHRYPLLKDSPASVHYVLKQVDNNPARAAITYSPAGNFFLLESNKISRIDATGRRGFSMRLGDNNRLVPFTHYVSTGRGIYDFSQTRPRLQRFVSVRNAHADKKLTVEAFHRHFAPLYAAADIVVYDEANGDAANYRNRAYLRTSNGWVLFYISDAAVTLNEDRDFGVTVREYPAKFNRTVLLKDVKQRIYSARSWKVRDGDYAMPERKMRYTALGQMKVMKYANERVVEEYRGRAIIHTGTALYRLSIGGETLHFSETAIKPRNHKLVTQMSWFVVPKVYQSRTSVSFLKFQPEHNLSTAGSGGVYALRRR